MSTLTVQLQTAALEDITRLAQKRNARKVKTNARWTQDITPLQANVVGLKGEFALAVLSGLRVDRTTRAKGDNGIDFALPDGRTLDVKTVMTERSGLYYNTEADFRADIAVLAALTVPDIACRDVLLVGWTTRERFLRLRSMVHHRQGQCPTLAAGLLSPMGELLEAIRGTDRQGTGKGHGHPAGALSHKH